MASKILMPKLSPTMEEGQISRWLKEEGDEIEANETIAEVDTDKATMEMTSLEAGTLLKIIVPGGENAKLGQTIGIIGEKGEDFSALLDEASSNGDAKITSEEKAQTEAEIENVSQKQKISETAETSVKTDETETAGRSYDDQRPGAKTDAKDQKPKTSRPTGV
jgi:pyruvate dehydrogenase E2 component (dihydrolipoamide acetyltransferase)